MDTEQRIALLIRLGAYMQEEGAAWQAVKDRAFRENGWFIPEYIDRAVSGIIGQFLQQDLLQAWVQQYALPVRNKAPKTIGIVMAGNIPMVGFHDFLCGFVTGHRLVIKFSSKDAVLLRHLAGRLLDWAPELEGEILFQDQLLKCEAYIATGSNNTGRYFDYYFGRFPSIIRKNRTSVALLEGNETTTELQALADDIMLYMGLGCRNVTQVYVPDGYDFVPLLEVLRKYSWVADHTKYRNNYDYNLALLLLNNRYYMTNETVLLAEEPSPFSPISQLNYQFYTNSDAVLETLKASPDVQALVGHSGISFGKAQSPSLTDYADGVDTMAWMKTLGNG